MANSHGAERVASLSHAERWALAGLALATFGTPLAMLPLGGNAFGPVKAVVLALGCALPCIAVATSRKLAGDTLELAKRRETWPLFALVLVVLGAALLADNPRAALIGSYPDYRGFALVLLSIVVGLGAALLVTTDARRAVALRLASVTSIALAVVAAGERLGLPPASLKLPGAVRTISTAGNASNLGVVLVMLLPLVLVALRSEKHAAWWRAELVAAAGTVVALAWTMSRGAWLASGIAVVVLWLMLRTGASARTGAQRRTEGHTRTWVLYASIALALVLAVATAPAVIGRAGVLLDASSATATWRFSTWNSAVRMIADRPLLGFGPNGFGLAYPQYKEPGQDDGRLGYVPAESPHNAFLEIGVTTGALGVLLSLAVMAIAIAGTLRGLRAERTHVFYAGIGASLVGATVALQLHYLTLDSAPLLAALLGCAVGVARNGSAHGEDVPTSRRSLPATRTLLALAGVAAAAVSLAASALVMADAITARAIADARSGAAWDSIAPRLDTAVGLAAWEPAIHRAAGRAAWAAVERSVAEAPAQAGARSYERASALSVNNPQLLAEQGRFLLAAAGGQPTSVWFPQARAAFVAASALDPASGLPLAGLGQVHLLAGESVSAMAVLEKATTLSPKYAQAWADLAWAYRLQGREAEAQRAEEMAASLGAGQQAGGSGNPGTVSLPSLRIRARLSPSASVLARR